MSETKITTDKNGDVKITHPKGKDQPNVTVLLANPDDALRRQVGGFVSFLREKAVVGLAVGFIIGQQAQSVIKQLVDSFITPFLNAVVGNNLAARQFELIPGSPETAIAWGKFIYITINFFFVLVAIYIIIKFFKLDKLDAPKETKKKKK